ncbi:MAG: TerB family tellurite resistance protein [Pseudohongiellaceae bacterium]|nr:TerB family tellurite resistance protein [Pseudohongiellaceae bacterium]
MLAAIKSFFDERMQEKAQETQEQAKTRFAFASAALLVELMKSDKDIDERERQAIRQVLSESFDLKSTELEEVLKLAELETEDASCLFEFTSLINEQYSYEERVKLLENLWLVAFADSALDKYEEHLIRKVADLIYVNHSDFIRTKLKAKQMQG